MIKVEHVKKSFKEKEVLKDITFEFLQDRVYVIIAPNGTGKTTFINTLCGFMLPDEGTISFSDGMDEQGFDVILSGERNLYVKNTVYENLIYFSMLKGMSKSTADAAIDREKEFYGILKAYDADTVTIEQEDGKEMVFEKSNIALIRLAFDF